jgi:DNA-directed RNA polymerase subunit RPC12/RpoP
MKSKTVFPCFDCQKELSYKTGKFHRVLRPVPGPGDDCASAVYVCNKCFKKYKDKEYIVGNRFLDVRLEGDYHKFKREVKQ